MKVVRIIARLNVGGPARHVAWLEAGLRRAGVESVLAAGTVPPGEDDMGYFAASLGVEPVIIPEMSREVSPKDAVTVWKLYRLLRRERPDVVHTHTAKAGTVGRVAGALYRWLTPSTLWGRPRACRFVHTYHGHIFHSYYGPLKTRLFIFIEKALALLATDRIVVISPQQYREIHEQFGVGRAKQFAVIPLGLDTSVFADRAVRRERTRREWGARDSDTLVGIVGRLTEVKNHALFLEAAALYKERFGAQSGRRAAGHDAGGSGAQTPGRTRFFVVGEGHLRGELEARARALGLADDVEFTGLRDDPENFYPALDVVALTSRNEGTPLTLIEAMANARAVVSTEVGGVVDLLGEPDEAAAAERAAGEGGAGRGWRLCERGVLVGRHDAEAFCEGLAFLAADEEMRGLLGERGRRFVEGRYAISRLLADVYKLYEDLTGRERAGTGGARDAAETTAAAAAGDLTRASARLKGD